MKMKLVLLSITAAALAVSADCQAMIRRAPARVATPRVQRASQRAFSLLKKESKSQVPQLPSLTEIAPARLHNGLLHSHAKFQELLVRKKIVDAQHGEVGKEMAIVGAMAFAGTILVGSMSHATSASILAGALAVPVTMITPFIYGYSCAGLGELDKEYASVTEELAALVRDQKHQLANPEDKQ